MFLQCTPTGVHEATLTHIGERFAAGPPNAEDFIIHKAMVRVLKSRSEMVNDRIIDWALAEAMAFGTLMKEGIHVRLSGKNSNDLGRSIGTTEQIRGVSRYLGNYQTRIF